MPELDELDRSATTAPLDRFIIKKIFFMTLFFIKQSSLVDQSGLTLKFGYQVSAGYRKFGLGQNCIFDNGIRPVIKI
jgi:hypothetical protein